MDVTKVLVWDIADVSAFNANTSESTNAEVYKLCVLSSEELGQYVEQSQYELDASAVSSLNSTSVTCFGVWVDDQLAGYLFFCSSPVNPRNNSGGSQFSGIGLEFSTSVRYLYKVLVLPEHRGKQLSAQLLRFAADYFSKRDIDCLLTTTDWTNSAFLKVSHSVGFTVVGTAGEIVFFGKHGYILPSQYRLSRGHVGAPRGDSTALPAQTALGQGANYIRLVRP